MPFILCILIYVFHSMHWLPCTELNALHSKHCIPCISSHALHSCTESLALPSIHCIPYIAFHALHFMHWIPCITRNASHAFYTVLAKWIICFLKYPKYGKFRTRDTSFKSIIQLLSPLLSLASIFFYLLKGKIFLGLVFNY